MSKHVDGLARSLAIPPMNRQIPQADRIRVIELVLRRQCTAAWDLAIELENDRIRRLQQNVLELALSQLRRDNPDAFGDLLAA